MIATHSLAAQARGKDGATCPIAQDERIVISAGDFAVQNGRKHEALGAAAPCAKGLLAQIDIGIGKRAVAIFASADRHGFMRA